MSAIFRAPYYYYYQKKERQISQTSSLQCLPLLVPLSLLKNTKITAENYKYKHKRYKYKNKYIFKHKQIYKHKYKVVFKVDLLSRVVNCFLHRGNPLQSASVAVGLELVHLRSKNVRLGSQKKKSKNSEIALRQGTFWFACRKNLCGFCLTGERVDIVCGGGAASTRHPGLNGITPRTCNIQPHQHWSRQLGISSTSFSLELE